MAGIKLTGFVALLLVCIQSAHSYPANGPEFGSYAADPAADTAMWSNPEPEDTLLDEPSVANDISTDVLVELVERIEALQSEVQGIKSEVEATQSELAEARADLEMTEVALEASSSALEAIETLMAEEAEQGAEEKTRREYEEGLDEEMYGEELAVETRGFDAELDEEQADELVEDEERDLSSFDAQPVQIPAVIPSLRPAERLKNWRERTGQRVPPRVRHQDMTEEEREKFREERKQKWKLGGERLRQGDALRRYRGRNGPSRDWRGRPAVPAADVTEEKAKIRREFEDEENLDEEYIEERSYEKDFKGDMEVEEDAELIQPEERSLIQPEAGAVAQGFLRPALWPEVERQKFWEDRQKDSEERKKARSEYIAKHRPSWGKWGRRPSDERAKPAEPQAI